jgi:hypothetical protein
LNGTSLHLQYSNALAVPPDGPIRAILTPGASLGAPLDEADNRKRLVLSTHHATHPPTPLYFCRPFHGLFSALTTGCIVPATHTRVGQRETPDLQYHEHVIATTGTSTNGRQSDIYHITAPNLPIISRFTWASAFATCTYFRHTFASDSRLAFCFSSACARHGGKSRAFLRSRPRPRLPPSEECSSLPLYPIPSTPSPTAPTCHHCTSCISPNRTRPLILFWKAITSTFLFTSPRR